jgi:uncharacterized protein YidB (DUF937 family)
MGLFDDAVPGGSIAKPIMVALGALLVGKMMGGFGQSTATPAPAPTASILPRGLGSLLERLTASGQGNAASSWLGSGPNQPIQPQQLGTALGQTTVSDLARHAGISEQELLNQLSQVLPGVVDKLTPGGRVPGPAEIAPHFA